MYAYEYGVKHFKHKTNFENLVVFSDVLQDKIQETKPPSENIYIEIEEGFKSPDRWFIHFNSRLSGEYGDFFLENNGPTGVISEPLESIPTEEVLAFVNEYIADFSNEPVPYYKINDKYYIKIDGSLDLDEIIIQANPSPKPRPEQSVEFDAFVTLFVSDNGAKLERAYQSVADINAHQVVIFVESAGGTNAFGTVFRIKKGKNVKTLPEVDRISISQVARAYGVSLETNDLSTMIREELKDETSIFYFITPTELLSIGGRVLRWGSNEVFSAVSGTFKTISEEINTLKLGEQYWKTLDNDKENAKFTSLLPKIDSDDGINIEAFAKSIFKTYIEPLSVKATNAVKTILENELIRKIVPFNLDKVIQVLEGIPGILKDFFEAVLDNWIDLYYFINGLIVGLINSIIDFIKSVFDILALLFDVLNAVIQGSTKFFESPGTYFSLLAESFEGLIDAFNNAFTLENLFKFTGFLASLPRLAYAAVVSAANSIANIKIDPGAIGYHLGAIVGFIASEVVTFMATGGTANVAKALKLVLKSYKDLLNSTVSRVRKTVNFGIDTFVKLVDTLVEFSKNIGKHIDTLKTWINEFIAGLQAKVILVGKVAYTFVDPISVLGKAFFNAVRTNVWNKLKRIGVAMLENEEGVYAFFYNGKNIEEGLTKKQAEEFLKDILLKLKDKSDDFVKKYLDEIQNIKRILLEITDDVVKHANEGEFSLPANPKKSLLPGKMKVGGHGQDNIDFLDSIGRKYKIEHTFENGVRIGGVEKHDKKVKRLIEGRNNTGQSWFPINWDKAKIIEAFEHVVRNNLEDFIELQDGPPPLFDIYEGVRVGVLKTKGKPATIFPDNAIQPKLNSKDFEQNPF
ncbi:EndoU domain-containing protein [Tenacibaculum sp. 190524A05c]|uniref:EndoU domain-containing protein n=1 Tax=Tenacibaculum platacis TaxID=3137852 RepID=UPI0032B1C5BA